LKLAAALGDLVRELTEEGVRFAVVGGLAASARGEARFTRDIDVAVAVPDDAQAENVVFAMVHRGYSTVATVEHDRTGRLATVRLRHPSGVVCDLMFASTGIEPEIVAGAEALELLPDLTVPTAAPESLLAMKTLSASQQRPRDLEDIRAILHGVQDYSEAEVQRLLQLIDGRGYARGQALLEKWASLRRDLRGS
jgi:hypothetical protein